jgi:peptidoglycan-associated lipoprotein
MTSGCAKKQRPDINEAYSNAALTQDKDMNFDPAGSDSGKIEGLYTVHFDYDKSNLTEETRNQLVKDADWLRRHDNKGVQIEGHCDRHGSTEYNLALGQKRADTVMHYLVNLGIDKNRISTVSYGKEKMVDDAETDEADQKNRRANFYPVETARINHLSNL